MNIPARINPDHIEIAFPHSRHAHDKAATIVDLMGGHKARRFEMNGNGSSAKKDLGLLSVIAGQQCFLLTGSRFDQQDIRDFDNNINGGPGLAMAGNDQGASPQGGAHQPRPDLALIRLMGSALDTTPPALINEISALVHTAVSEQEQEKQIAINDVLTQLVDLKNLSEIDALPAGQERMTVLLQELTQNILSTSIENFDNQTFSHAILDLVQDQIVTITKNTSVDLNILQQDMQSIAVRLDPTTQYAQITQESAAVLKTLLESGTITQEQRAEIENLVALLESDPETTPALTLSRSLATLSPAVMEMIAAQNLSNGTDIIASVKDVLHVRLSQEMGVSVETARAVDVAFVALLDNHAQMMAQPENLSPAQQEILSQLNVSLAAFEQAPASLANLAQILTLQNNIAEQFTTQETNVNPGAAAELVAATTALSEATVALVAQNYDLNPAQITLLTQALTAPASPSSPSLESFVATLSEPQKLDLQAEIAKIEILSASGITVPISETNAPLQNVQNIQDVTVITPETPSLVSTFAQIATASDNFDAPENISTVPSVTEISAASVDTEQTPITVANQDLQEPDQQINNITADEQTRPDGAEIAVASVATIAATESEIKTETPSTPDTPKTSQTQVEARPAISPITPPPPANENKSPVQVTNQPAPTPASPPPPQSGAPSQPPAPATPPPPAQPEKKVEEFFQKPKAGGEDTQKPEVILPKADVPPPVVAPVAPPSSPILQQPSAPPPPPTRLDTFESPVARPAVPETPEPPPRRRFEGEPKTLADFMPPAPVNDEPGDPSPCKRCPLGGGSCDGLCKTEFNKARGKVDGESPDNDPKNDPNKDPDRDPEPKIPEEELEKIIKETGLPEDEIVRLIKKGQKALGDDLEKRVQEKGLAQTLLDIKQAKELESEAIKEGKEIDTSLKHLKNDGAKPSTIVVSPNLGEKIAAPTSQNTPKTFQGNGMRQRTPRMN